MYKKQKIYLKNAKSKFLQFFFNIATSGKYAEKSKFFMTDHLIQYALQNSVSLFGSIVYTAFTVMNYRDGVYPDWIICVVMALVCFVCFMLGRNPKMPRAIPVWTGIISNGLTFIILVAIGNSEGANFLFIYLFPSLAIMGGSMYFGILASTVLIVIVSLEMFAAGLSSYVYHFDVSIRMFIGYILVFFVTIVVEITRKIKDRHIEEQNKLLMELKEEAETANIVKSNFLANMSHEIRTPMNAITGMAELLLRRNLPDEAKNDVQDIKQAAGNLISIINDILDFSKIETGRMEIISAGYLFSSLLNDTVNIIRMRIMERPIRFLTNIDGSIPNKLIGDEVRLRQIILNLLANAEKYTQKGYISLSITADMDAAENSGNITEKTQGSYPENKQVRLRIAVSDTGYGIKPEDQKKLFNTFVQVDMNMHRSIEGTGLGLAITKRLCNAMGGDITVESEYGKGSTFTVIIPQGIGSDEPFAEVPEPERKKVLVYERRSVYAQSVCWTLKNLGVPYAIVHDPEEFADALHREEWFFVLSGYNLYETVISVMDAAVYPGGKKPSLALLADWVTGTSVPNAHFISLPVHSLSIANTLNGKADRRNYFDNAAGLIRFTLPGVKVLAVDDTVLNLKVTEGLLAPYLVTVDSCQSGREAIEMEKKNYYDIVFMDHMMPDMDGVEATAAIRMRNKDIPIIALTANAVSGMREMFLENGFSDFLAKPIDVANLDEILSRWIPAEKRAVNQNNPEQTAGNIT